MHKDDIKSHSTNPTPRKNYVLIVDTDNFYGQSIATFIERETGIETLLAGSIDDALEQLAASSIGLVISTYYLGEERGTDLLKLMRSSPWLRIPFLLTSADHDIAIIAQSFGIPFIAKSDRALLSYVNTLFSPPNG